MSTYQALLLSVTVALALGLHNGMQSRYKGYCMVLTYMAVKSLKSGHQEQTKNIYEMLSALFNKHIKYTLAYLCLLPVLVYTQDSWLYIYAISQGYVLLVFMLQYRNSMAICKAVVGVEPAKVPTVLTNMEISTWINYYESESVHQSTRTFVYGFSAINAISFLIGAYALVSML